ncbi:MAG TPA: hypothetical protein VK923_20840 [Euzebyales bacterium]|nr:hypothetical protein [Euzebyales bacterium]
MLRLAISLAYERGIEVVAPVHDAVMIESGASDITDAVDAMQQVHGRGVEEVLDGYPIATDAEITVWPDRCTDARGADLWGQLTRLLRP